jgi:hypothetical protein
LRARARIPGLKGLGSANMTNANVVHGASRVSKEARAAFDRE